MKKAVVLFGIVILLVPTSAQKLLVRETFTLTNLDEQYTQDLTLSVYAKKGSTYEIEEQMIHLKIAPQVWVWKFDGRHWKYHFSKVLVSVVIKDSEGRITADFESYLNCSLKNCDRTVQEAFLFWDHAGEERADRAGNLFEVGNPLVVKDEYCEVTLNLISFLETWTGAFCDPSREPCESDVECVVFLRSMTLEISVNYTTTYATFADQFEEASDHVQLGDDLLETGEYGEAVSEYEKAKYIYDQLGDAVRAAAVTDKIEESSLTKGSEHAAMADQFFEAGEYDNALIEYEKAKKIYDTISDEEMSSTMQTMIDKCKSYQIAAEELDEGITLYEEAESADYQWRALNLYQNAKSHFEKAKKEFENMGDAEKSDECSNWIDLCDTHISTVSTGRESVDETSTQFQYSILIIALVGIAVIVVIFLKYKPAKMPSEPEEFRGLEELKKLKRRLAAGEITVEEYKKVKSTLEKTSELKRRLAAGEITVEEYKKSKPGQDE